MHCGCFAKPRVLGRHVDPDFVRFVLLVVVVVVVVVGVVAAAAAAGVVVVAAVVVVVAVAVGVVVVVVVLVVVLVGLVDAFAFLVLGSGGTEVLLEKLTFQKCFWRVYTCENKTRPHVYYTRTCILLISAVF